MRLNQLLNQAVSGSIGRLFRPIGNPGLSEDVANVPSQPSPDHHTNSLGNLDAPILSSAHPF